MRLIKNHQKTKENPHHSTPPKRTQIHTLIPKVAYKLDFSRPLHVMFP